MNIASADLNLLKYLDVLLREKNVTRAAEQLGISPRTLRYKLAQMRDAGIDLDAEMALV